MITVTQPREPWPLVEKPLWKVDLDNIIMAAPVIADDQVYIETLDSLVVLDGQTGARKWKSHVDLSNTNANMAVGDGFVAIGSQSQVIVLRTDTGRAVWQYSPAFQFPITLIIDKNRLYVSFAFDEIRSFDLSSGRLLWKSFEPSKQHRQPFMTLSGQRLIVVQAESRIYALDSQSGATVWENYLNDGLYDPVAVNTEQVVVTGGKKVYGVEVKDGLVRWETPSGGQGATAPLVADSRVFWTTHDGQLRSANVQDGNTEWMVNTNAELICPPLASDGRTVWVRTSYPLSALISYDAETGRKLTEQRFNIPIYQFFQQGIGSTAASGRLYLVSGNRVAAYAVPQR
jgi:outer membrane protein assembly factor BamB